LQNASKLQAAPGSFMRNTMLGAYAAVPVTFAGMAVTLPESLRSRSPESSVTLPESPVTFDRNTQRTAELYSQHRMEHPAWQAQR
jgi:hypothetical protein